MRLRRNENEKAAADFTLALAHNSQLYSARYGRGLAEHRLGRNAGADADLTAVVTDHEDVFAQFMRWNFEL